MTVSAVKMAFESKAIVLPIAQILPLRQLYPQSKKSHKYRQILSSIKEVGLVEPPVVVRNRAKNRTFILLDGHLRLEALKDLGKTEVTCLVSTDDEAFTYNKRINRLTIVQEHRMVLKAIERGVPEDRIARALDVNVAHIRRKRKLLDGICPEVVDLLKDKHCAHGTFEILKRMSALRQVEVVELMISLNTFSETYAKALLAATPQDQLADPAKPKAIKGISPDQMARMETEMLNLQREYKVVEQSYGVDVLNLVLARGYLGKLLANARVVRFLSQHYADFLREFQNITEIASLNVKA